MFFTLIMVLNRKLTLLLQEIWNPMLQEHCIMNSFKFPTNILRQLILIFSCKFELIFKYNSLSRLTLCYWWIFSISWIHFVALLTLFLFFVHLKNITSLKYLNKKIKHKTSTIGPQYFWNYISVLHFQNSLKLNESLKTIRWHLNK